MLADKFEMYVKNTSTTGAVLMGMKCKECDKELAAWYCPMKLDFLGKKASEHMCGLSSGPNPYAEGYNDGHRDTLDRIKRALEAL